MSTSPRRQAAPALSATLAQMVDDAGQIDVLMDVRKVFGVEAVAMVYCRAGLDKGGRWAQ